jgi:ParB/RepB/Spo0J family partition protein
MKTKSLPGVRALLAGHKPNGATPAEPAAPRSQTVPLDTLRPSPLNPRKTFDEAELQQLADSLRSLGMCQPILVRAVYKTAKGKWLPTTELNGGLRDAVAAHPPGYEIADGERRYRAAKLAGLVEVPVIVRELTDRQMLEIMIVSFEQRADVSPLEKAAGYQRLIDDHDATVEEIAAQVGRSVSTIRGLLKLSQLPRIAAQALAGGEIPLSTAELIARVPLASAREELALMVLCGDPHGTITRSRLRQDGIDAAELLAESREEGDEPLSFRATRELVEAKFTRELKQAPFSRKSIELLPAAGSCEACPKRTGNDPDAAGSRADVCTDPACYAAKVEAHAEQQRAAAQASGKTVLDGAACDRIFSRAQPSELQYDAPYVDLGGVCYADPKHRTYDAILRKSAVEGDVVLGIDPAGGVHRLLPRSLADKALRAAGIGPNVGGSTTFSRQRAEANRKAKLGAAAARIAVKAAGVKVRGALGAIGLKPAIAELLRAVLLTHLEESWSDAVRVVERARGLKAEGRHKGPRKDTALADHVRDLTDPRDLLAVWAELVAAKHSLGWGNQYLGGPKDSAFWKAMGVAPKSVLQRVTSEAKARGKGKKSKAATSSGDDDDEDDDGEPDLGEVDATPSPADPDDGDDASPTAARDGAWRSTPLDLVEVLDLPDVQHLTEQGIRNLGQVHDHLRFGRYLGLKQKLVVKLQRHIEALGGDGLRPDPVKTQAEKVLARKCRGCQRSDQQLGEEGVYWSEEDLCSDCAEALG